MLTEDGYRVETFEEILARLESRVRETTKQPNLDVRDPRGLIANIYLPMAERFAKISELGELIYNAPDPKRSTRQGLEVVGVLRGVSRRTPKAGICTSTSFAFDAEVSGDVLRGSVRFHPVGAPDNVWINSEDFSIPSAGVYAIATESELVGANKTLLQGSEMEILDGPSSLTEISVGEDATPGQDLEDEMLWRSRAIESIDQSLSPVALAVEKVQNVVRARVIETPGEIRVIVHGFYAEPNAIAQAILSKKLEGISTLGDFSGVAVDSRGEEIIVRFDRSNTIALHAVVSVRSAKGYSQEAVKAALQSTVPKLSGQPWVWAKAAAAAVSVDGVDDLLTFTISREDAPSSTNNVLFDDFEVGILGEDGVTFL